MRVVDSHLLRAGLASFWSYSGRVFGLGWTFALIHVLGIGSYGQYAVAVAAAAILNAGIDNAFFVRSLRLDEARYERERCARVLFGIAVAAVGVLCYLQWFVAGFAVVVAAGELLFNTYKSRFLRAGRPDVTMRFDAVRQLTSIALGASYLYLASDPTVAVAGALYLLPYLVIVVLCLGYVPGRSPAFPGGGKEFGLLSAEAFVGGVYTQGDVLIIGWIAGSDVAGYYSVALVTAIAISMIGQNFANTYIEKIRDADGHLSSAPSRGGIARVGLITGASMAAVGVGVLVWGGADETGWIAVILSVFVFARSVDHSFIVVLFVQKRDALRVRATLGVAAVKLAVLPVTVASLGGVGAAVVCAACELLLLAVYYRAVYHSPVAAPLDREVVT